MISIVLALVMLALAGTSVTFWRRARDDVYPSQRDVAVATWTGVGATMLVILFVVGMVSKFRPIDAIENVLERGVDVIDKGVTGVSRTVTGATRRGFGVATAMDTAVLWGV